MDLKALQSKEIQAYILKHQDEDVAKLALKLGKEKHPFAAEILNQVKGRQKAKQKIPQWLKEGILFPPTISLEQCSSEQSAEFKTELITGKKLIDLSAGFGVDAYYFSKVFEEVILVEPNTELIKVVEHNYSCFGIKNAAFENIDAAGFLNSNTQKADWIYADPSRRTDSNQKVYKFSDCQPNIPELLPKLWEIAPNILIKAAPLLDIHAAMQELQYVKKAIVLSLNHEVKEVLYLLEQGFEGEEVIVAIDLLKNSRNTFEFYFSQEKEATFNLSFPQQYLYEPNAAILKAGAFKTIADKFGLKKLHPNSHLYTSDDLITDFPGRFFKVIDTSKPDKKSLKQSLPGMKANVSLRNFHGSTSDFIKKTGIKEGGDIFLFATTLMDEKAVALICEKLR
ncbi:MAG: class I SAM-dependent methyltransferase [Bacteroidetes bacterium]|nr:class I SAM-dependent methyltransferase [Bacteroidota bacterium]